MGLFHWLTGSSALDWTLTCGTSVAALVIGLLYTFQSRLIYLPQFPQDARRIVWKPSQFGFAPKQDEEIFVTTPDGVTIHGYFLSDERKGKGPLPTFIYFQGNAGNIGHRLPFLQKLHECVACNTFIVSYRGFGLSEGIPSEGGLRIDAQAALDYVLSRSDVDPTRIVLYGQSIGGAVAFDLAARNQSKVHAIVLENTFLSLPKLIPHVMPWIGWASMLCHQKWESEERLREMVATVKLDKKASLPHMLFLSGAIDELVPPLHMQTLHRAAKAAAKSTCVIEVFPKGNHVDTVMQPGFFEAIAEFMASIK